MKGRGAHGRAHGRRGWKQPELPEYNPSQFLGHRLFRRGYSNSGLRGLSLDGRGPGLRRLACRGGQLRWRLGHDLRHLQAGVAEGFRLYNFHSRWGMYHLKHIDYRGDIQIYRAIAVLQVLLFHLGILGFHAGFLGVDIFFVISGYLMTMLYTPSTTPTEFYVRRARRLMPAYFAAIAFTMIAGYYLTLPTDFRQLVTQILFASALLSNIGFWLQNSYFSQAEFNPLLHLWSLGVECQFYLFFPLLIFIARKWRLALSAMGVGSLALCLWAVLISPKLSFFMLPMRVWEFAIGMWAASQQQRPPEQRWLGLIGVAGMLLIPLLHVQGDDSSIIMGHPALAALFVACATGMALLFRLPENLIDSFIGKLLQRIGNVSYSLYLVHWPILVLAHYVPFGGTRTNISGITDIIVCAALIVVATLLLYFFFERAGAWLFSPLRIVFVAFLLASFALVLEHFQLQRFDKGDNQIFAAWTDRATYRCGKMFRLMHPRKTICPIGDGDKGNVFLIGDSKSDSIKQAFALQASRVGLATYFAVDNDPLITPGLDGQWLLKVAHSNGARAVFLHYSIGNLRLPLIEEARRALANSGITLFLVLPTPEYSGNVPHQLYRSRHGGGHFNTENLSEYRREVSKVTIYLHNTPDIKVIDVAPLFCKPQCRVADAMGNVFYFDDEHLTLTGANVLAPAIAAAMNGLASDW